MKKTYTIEKVPNLSEFIAAHQEDYGWTILTDACLDFKNDIQIWQEKILYRWAKDIGDTLFDFNPIYEWKLSAEWLPHMIKYGFFKDNSPKIYKVGNRFRHNADPGNNMWMIAFLNTKLVQLVNMNGQTYIPHPTEVNDPWKITQDELDLMRRNCDMELINK